MNTATTFFPDSVEKPFSPTRIPRPLVWSVVGICVMPFLLMVFGVDFGSRGWPGEALGVTHEAYSGGIDPMFHKLSGAFSHTILEWSAFCVAIFTVLLAFSHYRITHDVTTPILGMALFCAGSMDAFHTLAADRLIEAVADNTDLIPFTWAVCRVFNAAIMIVGVSLFLLRGADRPRADIRFLIATSIGFGVVAYAIIHYAATSTELPQTMYPDALITRPWDVGPLLLFLFAGLYLYPKFYRQNPSLFAHALVISAVPEVVVELHMAFGSTALFDANFNVAHFLKIVAYVIPFLGLLLDYVRTYQDQQQTLRRLNEARRALTDRTDQLQHLNDVLEREIGVRTCAEHEVRMHADRIKLLHKLTTAANESPDIDTAMQFAIDRIAKFMEWPVGHVYLLSETDDTRLVSSGIWYLEDAEEFAAFRGITGATTFSPGVGLPGRVLERGEPAWIEDVTKDTNFTRANHAVDLGVRGAFAFPVLEGMRVVAVLEFFSREPVGADQHLISFVRNVGVQLGRITERKKADRALAERAVALERSNEELEQFAYVAAHDLQEPLRMVASYTQLLKRRYQEKLDQEANEFIDYAVDGAKRMQRLLQDLLEYSRVDSQGKPLERLDATVALEAACANLKPAIEDAGAHVTFDTLPEVMGDDVQLGQLFQNLLANAIKFRGVEPPRVTVSARRADAHWEFCVRDNGIGIDPEHAERIFVIFQRLHTRQEYPGTGIGLAVCKKIVERHQGRIWVESEAGVGTAVKFTLPSVGP